MMLLDMFDSMLLLNMLNEKLEVRQFQNTQLLGYLFSKKNTILMLNKENNLLILSCILIELQLLGKVTSLNESTHLIFILDLIFDLPTISYIFYEILELTHTLPFN